MSLSVIIPSRQPQFLRKTIKDLLDKAEGEVEVIVCFDGIWPTPDEMPLDDPRVVLFHHGEVHNNKGMRASINAGMNLAKGDYVMKADEHTMVGQGYDRILAEDCEDDWVVIPRRKRLDPETWTLVEDGRPPIDYMFVDYPFKRAYDKTCGLYGAEWRQKYYQNEDKLIDDTPTMQGSCYYMKKSYWDKLLPNGMDDTNYGPFNHEAQEISMAAWLSGGRVIVNKNTFYAHFHKGKKGKGYNFTTEQYKRFAEWKERARLYAMKYWLTTKDYKYDFDWFINEKFPDSPNWPKDWRQRLEDNMKKDYSALGYADDFWLSNLKEEK